MSKVGIKFIDKKVTDFLQIALNDASLAKTFFLRTNSMISIFSIKKTICYLNMVCANVHKRFIILFTTSVIKDSQRG